jgi:hypothetical protein
VSVPVVLLAATATVFAAVAVAVLPVPREVPLSCLAALLVALAAWGFGGTVVRRWPALDRELAGWEWHAAAALLGLGLLAGAVFALGVLGVITRGTAVATLTVGLVLAGRLAWLQRRAAPRPRAGTVAFAPAAACGIAPALAVSFLASLPPPTWFDALEYHLAIPAAYVLEGRLAELPDNFFSHLPHAGELVDTLLLALVREARPAPLHWIVGVLAAVLVARLARRHLHPAAGPLAAAVFLTYREASLSLYAEGVDLYLTAAAVLAVDLFLAARRGAALLPAAGLFAGLACAFKAHGIAVVAALALAAVLLGARSWPGAGRTQWLAAAALLAVPLVPWAAVNLVRHANPVYPFLGALFGGPPGDAAWLAWISEYTRSMAIDGGDPRRFPAAFAGLLFSPSAWNPLPLAALALPWLRGRRPGRRAAFLIAALLAVGWVAIGAVPRYGLPVVAVLSALGAAGVCALAGRLRRRGARRVLAGTVGLALAASAAGAVIDLVRARDFVPYLVGSEGAEEYQLRLGSVSPAAVFRTANAVLRADARVLSLDEPRMFGLWRRFTAATIFDRRTLRHVLAGDATDTPDTVARRLRDASYSHLLVNRLYFADQAATVGCPFDYDPATLRLIDELLASHATLVAGSEGAALYELRRPAP